MYFFRYTIFLFVVNFNFLAAVFCQQKKLETAALEDIFKDLPINDPSSLSIIAPGETGAKKIKNYISVTGILNKPTYYEGEPILLTYKLLSALKSTSSIVKDPEISGVLSSSMYPDNEFPKFKKKDGISFSIFNIKQFQLIPDKPGKIQIGAIAVNNEVAYIKDGKSLSYSGITYSNPITLNLLTLPQKEKPHNFSGSIGNFEIKAILDKDTFPEGENNKLIIQINGSGNLYSLKAPIVLWPSGLHNFESSEKSDIDGQQFPMKGNKVISIPFIAEQTGDFTIPSIEINFFDPQTKKYRKSATVEIHTLVTPSIARSKTIDNIDSRGNKKSRLNKNLWILITAGVLVTVGIFIIKKLVTNRRIKEEEHKKATVIKNAIDEIARIEKENERSIRINIEKLSTLELDKNYALQFKQTLVEYLHFKLKTTNPLPEEMIEAVNEFDKESSVQLRVLLKECDMLLYTGTSPDQANREKLLSSLNELIIRIDQYHTG